jgi:hypothetical protein
MSDVFERIETAAEKARPGTLSSGLILVDADNGLRLVAALRKAEAALEAIVEAEEQLTVLGTTMTARTKARQALAAIKAAREGEV